LSPLSSALSALSTADARRLFILNELGKASKSNTYPSTAECCSNAHILQTQKLLQTRSAHGLNLSETLSLRVQIDAQSYVRRHLRFELHEGNG